MTPVGPPHRSPSCVPPPGTECCCCCSAWERGSSRCFVCVPAAPGTANTCARCHHGHPAPGTMHPVPVLRCGWRVGAVMCTPCGCRDVQPAPGQRCASRVGAVLCLPRGCSDVQPAWVPFCASRVGAVLCIPCGCCDAHPAGVPRCASHLGGTERIQCSPLRPASCLGPRAHPCPGPPNQSTRDRSPSSSQDPQPPAPNSAQPRLPEPCEPPVPAARPVPRPPAWLARCWQLEGRGQGPTTSPCAGDGTELPPATPALRLCHEILKSSKQEAQKLLALLLWPAAELLGSVDPVLLPGAWEGGDRGQKKFMY